MSYDAKIVRLEGNKFRVHFDNGQVEQLSNLKEYREFIKYYKKKQSEPKKKKIKREDKQ